MTQVKYSDLVRTVFADDRYALEERAAIHEYEGELTRAEAEARAVKEYYEKLDEEGFGALVEVMNER